MNFRSTHNGDGEGRSLAGDVLPFPSPARRAGQTANSQPPGVSAAASAGVQEGAGVSSASASSFVPLGSLTHAVVLRLQGGFPKIRVAGAPREEERARRPLNRPPGGDEPAD